MSLALQRETTEYIFCGVTGDAVTGAVELAFLDAGQRPEPADWETAIKIDGDSHDLWAAAQASGVSGDWYVAVLIGTYGSGGLDLAPGDYQPWLRLTDTDERPVRLAPVTLEIV